MADRELLMRDALDVMGAPSSAYRPEAVAFLADRAGRLRECSRTFTKPPEAQSV